MDYLVERGNKRESDQRCSCLQLDFIDVDRETKMTSVRGGAEADILAMRQGCDEEEGSFFLTA